MEDLTPIVGTELGESLVGTDLDESIEGLGGDDSLAGGAGSSDSLQGGAGNDTFTAESGSGRDVFDGGDGIDTIVFDLPYTPSFQRQIYVPADTGRFNPDGEIHLFIGNSGNNIVKNVEFAQFEDGIIPLDYQLTIDEVAESREISISGSSSDNPSELNVSSGTIIAESVPLGSIDIPSYPYRQSAVSTETDFSDQYFPIATFTVANTESEPHVLGDTTQTIYNDNLEFTLDNGNEVFHLRPRYGGFGNPIRYNGRYDGDGSNDDIFNVHKGGGSVRIEQFDPETGELLDPHTRLSFFNAGTLEGEPRELSAEDEQTLLAQSGWNGFNVPEGETRTFTQYARISGENPLYGVPLTSVDEIDTEFNIELVFSDPSIANNTTLQNQIREAADYWQGLILNDLPDVGDIDDLRINVVIEPYEPCNSEISASSNNAITSVTQVRTPPLSAEEIGSFEYIPYEATLTINSLALDRLENTDFGTDIFKHEIAHAIGFNYGTFSNRTNAQGEPLIKEVGEYEGNLIFPDTIGFEDGESLYGFTGESALAAYRDIGGSPLHESVPLESIRPPLEGCPESAPAHWHEWLFPDDSNEGFFGYQFYNPGRQSSEDELMTPINVPGNTHSVSQLTLAAFQDLGFDVDISGADNISVYTEREFLGTNYVNPLFELNY